MMRSLGQYVVTLTAAAIISGMVLSMMKDGPMRSLLRMVCGVFVAVTALSPLVTVSLPDISFFATDFYRKGEAAATIGEEIAMVARQDRIKNSLEAYILDKAAALGLNLSATVTLDEAGNPLAVQIQGTAAASEQRQLEEMLTNDLGIAKENQDWTG